MKSIILTEPASHVAPGYRCLYVVHYTTKKNPAENTIHIEALSPEDAKIHVEAGVGWDGYKKVYPTIVSITEEAYPYAGEKLQ